MNAINIIALLIGMENLYENRTQSAQNDVQSANQQQAEYLLDEINKRFEEQNKLLERILGLLEYTGAE